MLEFLKQAISALLEQIMDEEIAVFVEKEGITRKQKSEIIKQYGSLRKWYPVIVAGNLKQRTVDKKTRDDKSREVTEEEKGQRDAKDTYIGASKDEAQALAEAKQRAALLTNSPPRCFSENGKREALALIQFLEKRVHKAGRRKGLASSNQTKREKSAKRAKICRDYYEKRCAGMKNLPSKTQVWRDLKNQWPKLCNKLDLKPPAKSTFQGYLAKP